MMKAKFALGQLYVNAIRWLLAFLMFFMPIKLLYYFFEISLSLLLFKGTSDKDVLVDMDKFFRLTNNKYSQGMFELPNYTLNVIWSKNFLDTEKCFQSGTFTIRQVIACKSLLLANKDKVAELMLGSLPYLLRIRLGVGSERTHDKIKSEVINFIEKKHNLATA